MDKSDESWQRRYLGEKSDKYLILMICVGFIIFCYGIFSLFYSSNILVTIINIAISFVGFLVSFISCMFYLRTRGL